MKKVPFHKIEVTQKIKSPDGEVKELKRAFKSKSEFKRQMVLSGFSSHILYELEKSGTVCFDFDNCEVSLELKGDDELGNSL